MARQRAPSGASASSQDTSAAEQELGSMYDYLAKIILLGPSGCGKSCLLHRFVRHEWRVLSSQTIGVEFSSRIVKVGTGARRKRIKLQLWDTAGQERFRSVTRSYYRGAAGALLIYDITNHPSFAALPTFLADARALASPGLTVVLVGNKADLEKAPAPVGGYAGGGVSGSSSVGSSFTTATTGGSSMGENPWREEVSESVGTVRRGSSRGGYSWDGYGEEEEEAEEEDAPTRAVSQLEASRWASLSGVPVAMETSALNGDNVEEVFQRLARMIVTKIELGEVDPDDPASGIQYGDAGGWERGRQGRKEGEQEEGWRRSLREWESVFRRDAARRGGKCC